MGNRFSCITGSSPPPGDSGMISRPNQRRLAGRLGHLEVFPFDMMTEVMSFCGIDKLHRLGEVCSAWRKTVAEMSSRLIRKLNINPIFSVVSPQTSRQFLKFLFPNALDERFYVKNLGDVGDVPSIPRAFIEASVKPDRLGHFGELIKDTHKLLLIPEYITITVEDSALILVAEGILQEDEGSRLIEGSEVIPGKRVIHVPVTLNNLPILIGTSTSHFIGFAEDCWRDILLQHGNKRVSAVHWSFQRVGVIGRGLSYSDQKHLAEENGFDVVPLIDRVLFNFLEHVRSGAYLDDPFVARTSTLTRTSDTPPAFIPTCVRAHGRVLLGVVVGYPIRVALGSFEINGNGIGMAVGQFSGGSGPIGPF